MGKQTIVYLQHVNDPADTMVMERHINRAKSAEMGCLCSQHGVPFLRYDSDVGGGHVWADSIGEIIMTTPKDMLGSLTFRLCDANGSDLGLGWEG